ncbi:helix-turn-helix domain-containing protein [Sporanaerobacter sp. PP17-6a]|uniref:helix-turn-helix domain-containing protein n=1 Tax=Sporanaerobacter sp. PP17-6a TaxID=1891289 RepID=UPI0008A089E9|nr:helix-turn-helix domain-containing protein [Sporanaerobacter sp. PP17-6a]SCL87911.1 DNA binding domain, excisionase family [Sporanaerobacter sp. PP17-6a]
MNEDLLKELNDNIKELTGIIKKISQEVFTAKEAAEYLRIGYDTILRLTRIGQIEYVANGNNYVYKKEFLDKWLDKNRKGDIR